MLFTYPDMCRFPGETAWQLFVRCACGVARRAITLFPPISHVIPRGLFQITKLRRCNSNVISGYSKVTGLNYVRDLWGSVRDEYFNGGEERTRAPGGSRV